MTVSPRPGRIDPAPAFAATDIVRPLDWAVLFGRRGCVEMDLGAGDGGFLAGRAGQHPERDFLAVERLLGRARKIARKAIRLRLGNLRVLRLESAYTLQHLVPPQSVSVIHLMYPDPWPKRRHWRRRVVQPEFASAVARCLILGGEFRFTTDHADYFAWSRDILGREPLLEPSASLWDFSADPDTEFQAEFEKESRETFRGLWKKAAGLPDASAHWAVNVSGTPTFPRKSIAGES
jgi:tRNA (guanine-N7-)-methyltransferase